jgi:hypothetical protein
MKADPKLALRMNEIEAFTQKSMASVEIEKIQILS